MNRLIRCQNEITGRTPLIVMLIVPRQVGNTALNVAHVLCALNADAGEGLEDSPRVDVTCLASFVSSNPSAVAVSGAVLSGVSVGAAEIALAASPGILAEVRVASDEVCTLPFNSNQHQRVDRLHAVYGL